MNETLKTISERYTCRSFTGTSVQKSDLEAIALAGAAAPTAGNSQRFRLIVITDKKVMDELDARAMALFQRDNPPAYERIVGRGGKAFYNAPAAIIVAIDPTGPWSAELDAGIVVENMALAAQSLGVGSCINAMASAVFQGAEGSELQKRLRFPDGFEFGIALLLGFPSDLGKAHEPALDKIIWL